MGKIDSKINLFVFAVIIAFMVLIGRVYYLQIIKGKYYERRSETNFIQERIIKHSRGKILDAKGEILAKNRLSYDLYVTFAMLPESLGNVRQMGRILGWERAFQNQLDEEILKRAQEGLSENIILPSPSKKKCKELESLFRTQQISGVKLYKHDNSCQIHIDSVGFPSNRQGFVRLLGLLKVDPQKFHDNWERIKKKSAGLARFKPSLLMADIGFDAFVRIENAISLGHLSGITVTSSKRREYPFEALATHVLGYINQISLEELQKPSNNYRSGDFVGRRGVEETYEDILRGKDGIERVIVDAKGRRFSEAWEEELLGISRMIEPESGLNVRLSIDRSLQEAAQTLFTELSGSVVVMDVNTGFIKALASFPSFDPNIMVSADNGEQVKVLLNDPNRPLRNKALQDHYAPGSVFKPITAMAGLNKKIINPSSTDNCTGTYKLHKTQWRCFKREGHGRIDMFNAIKVSCDHYFYDLGFRLGLENLSTVASILGFGEKTGVPLVGEIAGILPGREYYKKRMGFVPPGAVVNMSIGQGDLNVTPMQVAVAYSAIANGGIVLKPQLVTKIQDQQGNVLQEFAPEIKANLSDSSYNFSDIVKALSYVAEPGGSAYGLRYNPKFSDVAKWLKENNLRVTGKTGTAQVVKLAKNIKHLFDIEQVPYKQRDHAWFVGLYPHEKPEIVVVVMTEHGGFGGSTSGPVAVRLMKKWQELSLNSSISLSEVAQ